MAAPAETATEIQTAALRKLGIVAAGETPAPADDTLAGEALDRMIDQEVLRTNMAFSKEAIPDEAKGALIYMLAVSIASDFNRPVPGDVAALAIDGARFLREQSVSTASETTKFVNY